MRIRRSGPGPPDRSPDYDDSPFRRNCSDSLVSAAVLFLLGGCGISSRPWIEMNFFSLILKRGLDRGEILPECISDDSGRFVLRCRIKIFDKNFGSEISFFTNLELFWTSHGRTNLKISFLLELYCRLTYQEIRTPNKISDLAKILDLHKFSPTCRRPVLQRNYFHSPILNQSYIKIIIN